MFSSNSAKIFFVFASLFCQACGFWRRQTDQAPATPVPFAAEDVKSAIPFSTKEPNVYQTEIVVTANGVEDVTFTARNETNRLTVYNFQTESETAVLELGENQTFLIAPRRKVYAEKEYGDRIETADFLIAELLNRNKDAQFETLGVENNLARYRVNLDDARNSEVIVSVDEKISLPVKQEFYSTGGDGEQKSLTYAVELKNFFLQTDAKFFEIPKDYRKVSAKEFRESARRK